VNYWGKNAGKKGTQKGKAESGDKKDKREAQSQKEPKTSCFLKKTKPLHKTPTPLERVIGEEVGGTEKLLPRTRVTH